MRNQKGQALVEFAIILPVLCLLLFGIFEFGRAMYTKNSLNNAARSGVRVAVVTPTLVNTDLTFSNTMPADTETIKLKIFENLLYIDKTRTIATIRVTGHSTAQPGDTVTVTVTGPFDSIVSQITDKLQISISDTLSGEASMRYE